MAKISLYDIFTGSASTKWLEPGGGISLDYSADYKSVIVSLSGTGPDGEIDIGLDPNPSLGGDLNINGYEIISDPGVDIVLNPGAGGHIILDGLTWPDSDGDAGDLLGTDGNGNLVWYKVPGISNSQPGQTFYVDQSVLVTGDGSKETPFKTIDEALLIADNGDTLVIYEGTYSGDYTIDKVLYFIGIDDAEVIIFGVTTVNAQTTFTNIILENNVDVALNNTSVVYFSQGSIDRENNEGVINSGIMFIDGTLIGTHITNTGTITAENINSINGLITTSSSLIIKSAIQSPMIDHVGGTVEIRNAPSFVFDDGSSIGSDVSIRSTSNTGSLLLDNISFKQSTGWSMINKTGTAPWIINNVGRNPLIDVLNGPRQYFITEASDLSSVYIPANYAATSNVGEARLVGEASITEHLRGIDGKLGVMSFNPANAYWVAQNAAPGGDGSFTKPYNSLSLATSVAASGSTILVMPGTYDGESIIVDESLTITGIGENIFTNSVLTLTGAADLKMNNINISHSSNIPFTVDNGEFKIYNSYFSSPNATAVKINQLSNDSELINSAWDGSLTNSDTNGNKLIISGVNSSTSEIRTDNVGSFTIVRDSAEIGTVHHEAGQLHIINVGSIKADGSGVSVYSDADDTGLNFLMINLSSTIQEDGSYGQINKTGDAPYKFGLNDFGSSDIITGPSEPLTISSDNVDVNYVATSYTSTNILTDHIEKIDDILNHVLVKPTRLYYVDTIDGLNDVYNAITETTFGFDSSIYITPGATAQFILHDDFEFKPGINLIGTGSSENIIVQMPPVIPNLIITSAVSGMVHETLWRDIKLNSPTIVNITNPEDELHYESMTINGDITLNSGRLIIRDSKINGVITVTGGKLEIWNSEIIENIVVGSGEVYLNGIQQTYSGPSVSVMVNGGLVKADNFHSTNTASPIFMVQAGKTIVTSLIVGSDTFNTVIEQVTGGDIYIGINNITAEAKSVIGTVSSLGVGI